MDDALTLEKLMEVVEKFPPPPFVAYTMRPAAYAAIRSQCKPHPFDALPVLNGVEVWEVSTQEADCFEWQDKEALRRYLERRGVRKDDDG